MTEFVLLSKKKYDFSVKLECELMHLGKDVLLGVFFSFASNVTLLSECPS